LTVYDNIRVGDTFGFNGSSKSRRERIDIITHFLGLTSETNTLASNLDLYTTKLVMLGSVLATGCKLLMLDEPLAGLSSIEINDMLQVVQKINTERKITVMIIEHMLDHLIDISKRLMILNDGEVIYIGDPKGVRENEKVIEVYLGQSEEIS
jgi:branched-chain amino acid transport system ATP-binding protein